MASSGGFFSVVVLAGMTVTGLGCADTDVYHRGESTTVVTQSGNDGQSNTRVTRTADGQEIISRSGGNVDISTQRSIASDTGDCDSKNGFFTSLYHMVWPDDSCSPNIRGEKVPTSEEYKDRMRDRMR